MSDRGGRRHDHRDYNKDSIDLKNKDEVPPNSRLFIVCAKSITEEDFHEEFSRFGTIEEVWIVKDRLTDEPKGVTYIKFSKTSEAALAMEEMNGVCIGSNPRPLKVLIAHSRDQGSRREINEEERLIRLFVVVPKSMSESELKEHFIQFGDIDYVSIVRERSSKESKGFGYVKYHRMSHAAKAYENCDRSFKPVFADPRPQKDLKIDSYRTGNDIFRLDTSGHNLDGVTRLTVIASPTVNQDQLWRLFDLIPGLDYCDLRKDQKSGQTRGVATVVYNNSQSAMYAKNKLHGFQYPPGQRLIVKFDGPSNYDSNHHSLSGNPFPPPFPNAHKVVGGPMSSHNGAVGSSNMPMMGPNPVNPRSATGNIQQDLASQLAETIAQATNLIQAAGLSQQNLPPNNAALHSPNAGNNNTNNTYAGEIYDPVLCSVKLPPPQPLAPVDSEVAERLFVVCQPSPPPMFGLKDVFGRFGNLIDIYILNGKNFGYAKYACKESAGRAISILHGQEVMGSRLKVMEAIPNSKNDSGRKRIKMDEN